MDESELKILILTSRFELRGSSTYTLRLAEHLPEHRISPRIICIDASRVDSERREHLNIREYPYLNLPILGHLTRALVLRENMEWKPDLIHIHSCNMLAAGVWLAQRFNCPYLLTVHDVLPKNFRLKFQPSENNRLIAVSNPVKTVLKDRLGLRDEDVTVIHCGVEIPTKPLSSSLPVLDPGHRPVVGVAGPLEAIKGLPFFLGAAQRVLAQTENVEFLICGAGPEEANLRRLAKELNISEHVVFVPNLVDVTEPLQAMDIFCLPSIQQGLGTIMLEAMAQGKPVIASGVGGVFSVIRDQETGLVVPPSNSEALAQKILELLNDPVRARALGEAGRKLVQEKFSSEQMVAQTVALYRELIANRKSRTSSLPQMAEVGNG
ncbi:MAG: glycosyltransferase family 4 protein [Planctomycetaceae bacterium]